MIHCGGVLQWAVAPPQTCPKYTLITAVACPPSVTGLLELTCCIFQGIKIADFTEKGANKRGTQYKCESFLTQTCFLVLSLSLFPLLLSLSILQATDQGEREALREADWQAEPQ